MKTLDLLLEKIKSNRFYIERGIDEQTARSHLKFITKKDLIQDQLDTPPFGMLGLDCNIKPYEIYKTSGTSGTPLLVGLSKNDLNFVTAIGTECFVHTGMGCTVPNEVVINCLNLSMWAGGFLDGQSIRNTGATIINFGTGSTIQLIELITQLSANYSVSLHCTPSYLPFIKNKLLEHGFLGPKDLGLHALYLGAEGGVQNNQFRIGIINDWGCNVYNANYGMSEVCSIFASAGDDNFLKFSSKFLANNIVEIYSDGVLKKITDCDEGSTGEIVVSTIYKEFQPLFRYKTNEIIKICSKEGGIFFEILGRTDDMIVFKGINFFPEQVRSVITKFNELTGYYQVESLVDSFGICQKLTLHLGCLPIEDSNTADILKERIRSACQSSLKIKFDIVFNNDIVAGKNKQSLLKITRNG